MDEPQLFSMVMESQTQPTSYKEYIDSYVLTHALVEQNHLLQQLRDKPRYIQDEEWAELERTLRNSYNLTPESHRHPSPKPASDSKQKWVRKLFFSYMFSGHVVDGDYHYQGIRGVLCHVFLQVIAFREVFGSNLSQKPVFLLLIRHL